MVDSIASNVRFYDYALKPGDSPVYMDVTEFLAEKNALLHGYESQRVIITQATKLLPTVYVLNGFLAGKPLRYCEGYREKRSDNAEGCLGLSSSGFLGSPNGAAHQSAERTVIPRIVS